MANSERSFQTELLTEMRKAKWHVIKIVTPFQAGVPDIYVKAPLRPACWLELKYEHKRPRSTPVDLSPLQRKFMRDEQLAGGHAGWALCVDNGDQTWDLYASNNHFALSVGWLMQIQTRKRGEAWDVNLLLEAILVNS